LVVISDLYPVTIFPLAIPRGASPCISFIEKRPRINDTPDDLLPFRCSENSRSIRWLQKRELSRRLRTSFNNIINNDSKRCVNLQFNFVASKRSGLKDVYNKYYNKYRVYLLCNYIHVCLLCNYIILPIKSVERTWGQTDPKQFLICYISENMYFFFFFNLKETFFAKYEVMVIYLFFLNKQFVIVKNVLNL